MCTTGRSTPAQTQREFEQLLREELVTYYFQPIFSAHNGRVAAYEALMRVNMPTITSPSQVMTLAHELDRLYDIERITLFKSGETYEQLQQKGLLQNGAFLFVNSIANVSLTPADVAKYQRRFPELLKYLVVEITEPGGSGPRFSGTEAERAGLLRLLRAG